MTTADAAKLASVSPRAIRAAIAAGHLRATMAGRDWIIQPADLAAWRKARRKGRPPTKV